MLQIERYFELQLNKQFFQPQNPSRSKLNKNIVSIKFNQWVLTLIQFCLYIFGIHISHIILSQQPQNPSMSSINYRSVVSYQPQNEQPQQQDDAEFFSVAQQYNQRKAKMINHRAMQAMNMIHNFNIKNNPKDPRGMDNKEEKTRKTRNDKEGREFTCGGCNLSYLSYPALYTHIKTKHKGVAPEGTIRGKNNNNKRRGRPKNIRAQPNLHYRPQPQFTFPEIYCKLVDREELGFLEGQQKDMDGQEDFKIESEMFSEQIKQLKNSTVPLITLPIIKILAIFLYNIKQVVPRLDILQTVSSITQRLVNIMNSQHQKILQQFQSSSNYYIRRQLPQNEQYCNYQKCDYVPVFVSWLYKRLDADNDQLEIEYLGDLCQWLWRKKLTYIRLVKPELMEARGINEQEDN